MSVTPQNFKREPTSLHSLIAQARRDPLWKFHDEKLLLIKVLRSLKIDFFEIQARSLKDNRASQPFDLLTQVQKGYLTRKQRKIVQVATSPDLYLILLLKFIHLNSKMEEDELEQLL